MKGTSRGKSPRKAMCKNCPHKYNVVTTSCDLREGRDLQALEKPHQCSWDTEFLCRGCVEVMEMNEIQWRDNQ